MTPIPHCELHTDFPRRGCISCTALRNSLHTRALVTARRAAPTPAEQADWDVLRERYDNLPYEDRHAPTFLRARNLLEILDDIERDVRGEVE